MTAPDQLVRTRTVTLYYPSSELRLSAETREVELPQIETFAIGALADEVLREMNIRWPGGFIPENVAVRATYRIENTAIIDLEAASLSDGWTTGSQAEILAVQSLVHSIVANFEGIDRVQLLINGGEAATFAGHLDLSKPIRADRSLVAPSVGR